MPPNECDVVYDGDRRKIRMGERISYENLKERIRTTFDEIRPRQRFHIVLYTDNKEYEIWNDNDVNYWFDPSTGVNGTTSREIRVYPGGRYSIWLRNVEHKITSVPEPDSYLMKLARGAVLSDFSARKFEEDLEKLLHHVKSATYGIKATGDQDLQFDIENIGRENLNPAILSCSNAFQTVRETSDDILQKIIGAIKRLRDGHDRFVEPLLREVGEQASKIKKESKESVTKLKIVEEKLNAFIRKVQDAIRGDDGCLQDIVTYLNGALHAIRNIYEVMAHMQQFWHDVKRAIKRLRVCNFMIDIREAVAPGADGNGRMVSQQIRRTKAFKLNAISFISRHAAIRDICRECEKPMRGLKTKLGAFLAEALPEQARAREKFQEMQRNEPPAMSGSGVQEREEHMDAATDETEKDVRDALGLPYVQTLEQLTTAIQETEYNVRVPEEVEAALAQDMQGLQLSDNTLNRN